MFTGFLLLLALGIAPLLSTSEAASMTKSDPGWCKCGWDTWEPFFNDPIWGWGSCDEPWFRNDRDVGEPVNECAPGYEPTACWSTLTPYYNTCRDNCQCEPDNQPPDYPLTAKQWEWVDIPFTSTTWGTEEDKFDRVATATFTHATADPIATEMFYAGADNTWILRFTGTATGDWNFTTSSTDPELNNHSGTITVTEPDPGALGFMSKYGNKWRWEGDDDNAFVPQFVMYAQPDWFYNEPDQIDIDIYTFLMEHGFNGFHTFINCAWFNYDFHVTNFGENCDYNATLPDSKTFDALELLIDKVHQAGGLVHIWAWGDEGGGNQTPTALPGGINGYVDQRLQRYIAARLGPLPGWSMGYGYDLDEWAGAPPVYGGDPDAVPEWHAYMHAHLGWFHFLGGRPGGPNSGTDHSQYVPWNLSLDYSSYEHHKPPYAVYVAALDAIPDHPVLSEDRFRVRDKYPDKDYTEVETRRGLYHSTMAGGVANIWGYLEDLEEGPHNPCYTNYPTRSVCSDYYQNKHWIKTYSQVFKDRFKKDMERANDLLGGGNDPAGNGVALINQSNSLLIIYKEDTNQITVDLSLMCSSTSAVAIDTTLSYAEIPIYPSNGIVSLPHLSDWVVVIDCLCAPPAAGDWIITESCTLIGTATAPANVIVQNNATLTIAANASLDIHFDVNYLLVKDGSGVRIKHTGRVY